MTKKTRTILVVILLLACTTATSLVLAKVISGWGEQADDDPWKKK